MGSEGGRRPWPRWAIPAGAILLSALGWASFHPDFRADPQAVSSSLREELAKTGFKATRGIRLARFARHDYTEGDLTGDLMTRQLIEPIDAVLTEKRSNTHRKESELAVLEETSGLYAGPIAVVRYWRTKPPLIGDLLPYQFWNSSRLSEFVVETNENFPRAVGGKLVARVAYEERSTAFGGGELTRQWRMELMAFEETPAK